MFDALKSKRGFTLVELMTTVVIVGIIASMAVPRFQKSFERMHFRTANRDIISTLRLARSKAVSEKAPHGVFFDSQNRTVTIFKDTDSPSLYLFSHSDSVIATDTLPIEFTYLDTDNTGDVLVFMPDGSARFTGGGHITTLAVTSSTVGIQILNVLSSTGRIKTIGNFIY